MKRTISLLLALSLLFLSGCTAPASGGTGRANTGGISTVYYTETITPQALIEIYEHLGREATGSVAVKISTGEPGGKNFLSPDLIGPFVQLLGATIVEANTTYGGRRGSTEMSYQVAEDHGFTAIAPVKILDEDGELLLPIANGTHLQENRVGAAFAEYDFHIVLSHFTGHSMAGFGGCLKNMSIGYATPAGKCLIHTAGESDRSPWGGMQDPFLESMAEAASSVADYCGENILYITVMNNLSVDCDCAARPADPQMEDIGIFASLDPVALDLACLDQIYAADEDHSKSMRSRIELWNGAHVIDHAAAIGLGNEEYVLVPIDG